MEDHVVRGLLGSNKEALWIWGPGIDVTSAIEVYLRNTDLGFGMWSLGYIVG